MRTASTPIIALLATLALAAGFVLFGGCESNPAEPVYDNPWDPDGPEGGDALQVQATAQDTVINVTWNQPQGQGILLYVVSHTLDAGGEWLEVGEVNATTTTLGFFAYRGAEPSLVHYFRVQAFTEDDFSIVGYGRTAAALAPPRMVPRTGAKTRASRYLDLLITVNEGDSLRLADNDSFGGAITIAAAEPGQPRTVPWDLGTGANNAAFEVHVEAFASGGYPSPSASLDFTAAFAPRHYVAGKPASVASRTVDLVVPTEGVTAMRFALNTTDLALAPWLAPADTVHGFVLAETANPQQVHGEYQGDFGYNSTFALTVTPATLTAATFVLDVPANRVIPGPAVRAISQATATRMRIGESAAFSGVPWQTYRDTAMVTLSAGEGRKVLYAQYRNDWADSPILSQYVDVAGQPVAVNFLAPAAGALLTGGTALQVRGTAIAGSASDRLDSVRVDLGDGLGWRAPNGSSSWDIMWSVPTVTADTPRTLRAWAWATDTLTAEVDTAKALISVTLQAP